MGGVRFDALDEAAVVRRIVGEARAGRGGCVVTANLDHVRRYRRDPAYRAVVDAADLVVADGMPVIWASRVQGTPLPERVAGSSLTWSLSRAAGEAGLSVFLLGGNPGVAERAGAKLEQECPGLRVAGTRCPPVGFENDPAEMAAIEADLRSSGADLVYVALGSPKQERLIERLRRGRGEGSGDSATGNRQSEDGAEPDLPAAAAPDGGSPFPNAASNAGCRMPDLALPDASPPSPGCRIPDPECRPGLLPGAWWLGVGISLSFVTGEVRRAPVWMQRMGLEWVDRLRQEPRRLFRRYVVEGVPFAATLLAGAAWRRVTGRNGSEGVERVKPA